MKLNLPSNPTPALACAAIIVCGSVLAFKLTILGFVGWVIIKLMQANGVL